MLGDLPRPSRTTDAARRAWGATGLAIVAAMGLLPGCFSMGGGPEASLQGQVALTFTGPVEVAVEAKTGSCGLLEGEGQKPFGFMAGVNDDPAVGFSALELAPGLLTLSLATHSGIFEAKGVAGALSGDHKTITVDEDLVGATGTEHVIGTVACP